MGTIGHNINSVPCLGQCRQQTEYVFVVVTNYTFLNRNCITYMLSVIRVQLLTSRKHLNTSL